MRRFSQLSKLSVALILVLLWAACGKDNKTEKKSPTPTPTLSIVTDFTGPILNSNTSGSGEACGEADPNNPNAGCGAPQTSSIEDSGSSVPLPLTEQTAFGLTIGIPEGFTPVELSNRLLISATDAAATPGDFTVVIRHATAEELSGYLAQITDLDTTQKIDRQSRTLTGYSIAYGERGEVAVFDLGSGQSLFINGFAAPGSWGIYSATFEKMLDSIELASN
ncbi:MAG: hypothetical protein HY862_06075 [Chloroflexi bacterium]|nr:hypothetical protein [Chloroflexota bacterium]